MRLSIIIISYNTIELTRQCLSSLRDLNDFKQGEDFEVIVVDNDSRDQSAAMISQEFPQVRLIQSNSNLGFSKGNNVGVVNTNPQSKYVLFLNSDTVVPNGTLSSIASYMDNNPEVGLTTCRVLLATGELDMDSHRGFPTPWVSLTRLLGLHRVFPQSRFLNGYYIGGADLSTIHEVDSVVGAFMFVRRDVGEQIGWWDEDYFLNGEDIDFCYRVKERGYRVVYNPESMIIHHRGASKGTRKESAQVTTASRNSKLLTTKASVDAMQIFYDKHYRKKYPRIINAIIDLGIIGVRIKRRLAVK